MNICGLPIGEIKQAAKDKEGLEELGKNWIDIVVLDINMSAVVNRG